MAPTPPEEIARQHAEAIDLVNHGMPCAPHVNYGEIPLVDKERPTCELTPSKSGGGNEPNNLDEEEKEEEKKEREFPPLQVPCCFTTRGHVNVTKLQALVREGYNDAFPTEPRADEESKALLQKIPVSKTNYWDPRNAASKNVAITRPSHDAWGIKKIVLYFCDDFTTRIYQLPWWKDFEEALQPILDLLPKNYRMVRMLFASLPPGVTIPVHHDTGEWVKATHRVHVPVIVSDPSKVLFRVGATVETIQRIDCTPGHVFEINNQAKHAVSNCGEDCRVHLILDYSTPTSLPVDGGEPTQVPHIVLEPGERLVQTRRSIDRWRDVKDHQRPTPTFIILGAQKGGTTSLYEYMVQHPWVIRARRRETHCLDWRWNDKLTKPSSQLAWCHKFFYTEELKRHPSCLTGDSTPSYLLDSRRVIPRIKRVFDWKLRFFVMLRDPVARTESHFAMVTSKEGTPAQLQARGCEWRDKTLQQVIEMELAKMNDCGLIPYWKMPQGVVDEDLFEQFVGSSEEEFAFQRYLEKYVPLNTGSYGLLTRGMYALQLRPWLCAFDREQFLVLQLEGMKKEGVAATMQKVWAHLDLPTFPVADETAKNTRDYEPMEPHLKRYLQRFFQPHNRLLAKVLGDVEWEDVWPYECEVKPSNDLD